MRHRANEPLPGPPDPWAPSGMPAFRSRPPYVMSEMIAAEPALAERLVRRLWTDDALSRLADAIRVAAQHGQPIVATGCGTSEHAAMALAALVNDTLELPVGREARAVPALESLRRPMRDGLLIGVSHEGGTHVTNEALRAAGAAGAETVLITAGTGSPGAAICDTVVATGEQDQSWCHTVGYLSPLVVAMLVSMRLGGARPDGAALRSLLDVADDPHSAASIAAGLAGSDRLLVAGTGPDYVTARELALKIAEGARLPSHALELETLLHGHLAAVNRWTGLIVVLTDAGVPGLADRARRVLGAGRTLGLPVATIMSESTVDLAGDHEPTAGRMIVPRTNRVPPLAGSLLAGAMALQRLAERLARARNVDPDTLGREDATQAAAHA